MGQKPENFCGATQIGANAPARRRAITRLSLVTGEKPVGLYRLLASRPPSAVHSARPSLLPSHQPAALWERRKPSLTPLHLWFAALNLAQAYAPDRRFVKRANALFRFSQTWAAARKHLPPFQHKAERKENRMLLTRSIRLKVSGGEIALLCGRCAGRVTVRVLHAPAAQIRRGGSA